MLIKLRCAAVESAAGNFEDEVGCVATSAEGWKKRHSH